MLSYAELAANFVEDYARSTRCLHIWPYALDAGKCVIVTRRSGTRAEEIFLRRGDGLEMQITENQHHYLLTGENRDGAQ